MHGRAWLEWDVQVFPHARHRWLRVRGHHFFFSGWSGFLERTREQQRAYVRTDSYRHWVLCYFLSRQWWLQHVADALALCGSAALPKISLRCRSADAAANAHGGVVYAVLWMPSTREVLKRESAGCFQGGAIQSAYTPHVTSHQELSRAQSSVCVPVDRIPVRDSHESCVCRVRDRASRTFEVVAREHVGMRWLASTRLRVACRDDTGGIAAHV